MDVTEKDECLQRVQEYLKERRFAQLKALCADMNPVDIGVILDELDPDEMLLLFRLLPKELAADVFVNIDGDTRESLIQAFSDRELKEVLDDLFLDDAVDMIEEMPANVVKRVLKYTSPDMRAMINEVLKYPKDSAGSLMTIEFVEFHAHNTVREAMDILKRTGVDKETIDTCYVIDERRRLIGFVNLRDLIFAGEEEPIAVVMDDNVVSVHTLDDQEAVADTVRKYDLVNIPEKAG